MQLQQEFEKCTRKSLKIDKKPERINKNMVELTIFLGRRILNVSRIT